MIGPVAAFHLVKDRQPKVSLNLLWAIFPPIGLFMLVLAASFHHLTVEDQGDRLSVSFLYPVFVPAS